MNKAGKWCGVNKEVAVPCIAQQAAEEESNSTWTVDTWSTLPEISPVDQLTFDRMPAIPATTILLV